MSKMVIDMRRKPTGQDRAVSPRRIRRMTRTLRRDGDGGERRPAVTIAQIAGEAGVSGDLPAARQPPKISTGEVASSGTERQPPSFTSRLIATSWQDALTAGNGTVGTLLYGEPGAERLVVSHERLFRPLHAPRSAPHTAAVLQDLRAALSAGRPQAAAETVVRLAANEGYHDDLHWTDPLVPGCVLSWTGPPAGAVTGYRRTVRFDTGLAEVSWRDGEHSTRYRTFVSRTDDVVVAELSSDRPGGLTGRLGLTVADGAPPDVTHSVEVHPALLAHQLRFTAGWPGAVTGCTAVARLVVDGPAPLADGDAVRVDGARRILVLLRLAVHRQAAAGSADADRLAAGLAELPADLDALLEPHARVHAELFGRCRLDLGGGRDHEATAEDLLAAPGTPVRAALVEKAFDAGRHTIISSTGALPPTLQGVWAGTWTPAWSSDYTLNGNVQNGALAALLSTATPELLRPLFDLVDELIDDLRDNARRLYGARGILLPARCSTHGRANHFNAEYCHTFWTAGAGWLGRFYVDYWLHTRDEAFLRDRALPFLREAAAFYADFLIDADGRLTFSPSYSPENASPDTGSQAGVDATMDLAVLRDLLHNLIRAERAVGSPPSAWRHWQRLLRRLPDYRVTADGALAEWLDPATGDNDGHRHASHLYPLWYENDPALLADDRLRAAAGVSIERRMRWRAEPGNDEMAFGLVQLGVAAAHLGDAATAHRCVTWLVSRYWGANMVSTHNFGEIFNVDACGGLPALVAEMLVQSAEDALLLLPALPAQWPSGTIRGVGTRAGVLVRSLRWDAAGLVAGLLPRVSGTVRVRLPWPAGGIRVIGAGLQAGARPGEIRLRLDAGTPVTLTVER